MDKKPIIGIISKNLTAKDFFDWKWQRINDAVRYALVKNGAIVIGILPQSNSQNFNEEDEQDTRVMTSEEKKAFDKTLSMCDGFVLQGGITSHYYEEYVVKYCYKNDIPILGICAGFNNIVRALGGTTIKLKNNDIHDRPDLKFAHNCEVIDKNSLFYKIVKQTNLKVNSVHTYIAEKIPDCLSVVAKSNDGQFEVVEAKDKKFFMGTKYHPELLVDDPNQNNIFKTFIKKCK